MTKKNNKFEEMFESASSVIDNDLKIDSNNNDYENPYTLNEELIKLGYDFDFKGIYIPYTYKHESKPDARDIYLMIERNPDKKSEMIYSWTSKEDGEYKTLNYFRRDILLVEEDVDDNKKASINKKLSHTGRIARLDATDGSYKNFFADIQSNIVNSSSLEIFKNINFEFPEVIDDEDELPEVDEVQDEIDARRNPTLSDEEKKMTSEVEAKIKENGLIEYYDSIVDNFQIGEHNNIYRKHLGAFNVIRGKSSLFFNTIAHSNFGKSHEDKIAFLMLIPPRYIFKKNKMTESSFTRYSEENIYFFDRMIIYFGDLGSKKAFDKVEDVFDILKILITEKEYSRDVSEGTSAGGFVIKPLELKVSSIGAVSQTVKTTFFDDDGEQLASRTLKSTTYDVDSEKIEDFLIALNYEDSKQNRQQKELMNEIKKFHCYLMHQMTQDIKIVNPYRSVFKRFVKDSEVPFRDLIQLMELFDAFCVLTYFDAEEINGKLVASQKQLQTFISDVCLENTLPPFESDFLKMLMGIKNDGSKTQKALTIIKLSDDNPDDEDVKELNQLTMYNNTVLEAIGEFKGLDKYDDDNIPTIESLEIYQREKAIAKLLEFYKLGGNSNSHKENVFFRVNDVKRAYGNRKAYKNIDDVGSLLNKLYKRGYVEKLDFKHEGKQNIYYLTSKCENLTSRIEITSDDLIDKANFLKETGFYDE